MDTWVYKPVLIMMGEHRPFVNTIWQETVSELVSRFRYIARYWVAS